MEGKDVGCKRLNISDNKTKQKWKARMPAVTGEIFQTNFEEIWHQGCV